jgi:hypothetical protein
MKTPTSVKVLLTVAAGTACASERAFSPPPPPAATSQVAFTGPAMSQLPLLYVVDGIRLQRDQVPLLSSEQISSVEILKGRAALKQYGPDGSYGVVVITTKAALVPQS